MNGSHCRRSDAWAWCGRTARNIAQGQPAIHVTSCAISVWLNLNTETPHILPVWQGLMILGAPAAGGATESEPWSFPAMARIACRCIILPHLWMVTGFSFSTPMFPGSPRLRSRKTLRARGSDQAWLQVARRGENCSSRKDPRGFL